MYDRPEFIIKAYRHWVDDKPKNLVVIAYVTMHGSTARMVTHLVSALVERGVEVWQFNLATTDIGKLAMSLVDAATVILAAPTVNVGPHPAAFMAAGLVNMLRPKVKFISLVSSYGWSTKIEEQVLNLMGNIKAEILPAVIIRGLPREADFKALENLALNIAQKHRLLGLS